MTPRALSARSPSVHRYFSGPFPNGLDNYLGMQIPIEQILLETHIPNLALVPAGTTPPNSAELLTMKRMDALLETLKEKFDMIIIDTPPILKVADAQIVSARADGVLVDLDGIDAVFERVFLADGLPGQLALLPDRNEAATQPVRYGAAQNEATRLDAGDSVHARRLERLRKSDDRLLEPVRIAQQGRDIAEHDARLGIVGNRTDQLLQFFHPFLLGAQMAAQSNNIGCRTIGNRACGFIGPASPGMLSKCRLASWRFEVSSWLFLILHSRSR